MSEAPRTAADQQAAIAAEYGVWTARTPIDIDGARAFNVGDPVPASHVTNGVVTKDQVDKNSKKG